MLIVGYRILWSDIVRIEFFEYLYFCMFWLCFLKIWLDGWLGSVNFYNFFEGYLERDFDSNKNKIVFEFNNLFWGNLF